MVILDCLHHDVDDTAGDDDDFLGSGAVELLCRLRVGEDYLLDLFARGVFGNLDGETYFAVELHGVLLRAFDQICLVALGPLGIADRGRVSATVPSLFGEVRCVGGKQDSEDL